MHQRRRAGEEAGWAHAHRALVLLALLPGVEPGCPSLTEGRVGYRGPSRSWDGVSRGPAVLPLELTSRVATYIVPHLVFCDIVTLF